MASDSNGSKLEVKHRHHSDSVDSGFDSLSREKSETDITKMLGNDMKDHEAFSSWLEEKFKGGEDGMMIEGKYFVGALLTDIGGNLIIRGTNVHLYVPPDALQQQQFVYIRILPPSLSSGPQLKEEDTCLTPIVECGPPGLKFQQKVRLTIPHCASADGWQFTVHEDSNRNDDESWKILEDTEANIQNANGTLTLEVLHFTRYSGSGSSHEVGEDEVESDEEKTDREIGFKWMKAQVTLKPVDGQPDRFKLTLQICNAEEAEVSLSIHVLR